MIKLTEYVRIHALTVAMFSVCILLHYPSVFYITSAVMLLHELAHCAAAVCIGLKVEYIAFYPFGVNLRLKNKIVRSLADEVILYISGPALNALIALCAAFICKRYNYEIFRMFYISNIMLFLMNMLPAIPLDGGIILRRILIDFLGYRRAYGVMRCVSAVISFGLAAMGAYVFVKSGFNFSLLLFASLIMGNMFTQSEKYDVDFVRGMMFGKRKNRRRVCHILADEDSTPREIASRFSARRYNVVYLTDSDGKITKTLTETEVINHLMDNNITI